jgi:hypothetical protein
MIYSAFDCGPIGRSLQLECRWRGNGDLHCRAVGAEQSAAGLDHGCEDVSLALAVAWSERPYLNTSFTKVA